MRNPLRLLASAHSDRVSHRFALQAMVLPCLLIVATLAGCSANRAPGPSYDNAWRQTEIVDVQVVVKDTAVRLTNTTAYAFGKSRLWLNQWYSREVDTLSVGETVELPLASFVDENGDEFRGGGFFATRKADKVVLAQLRIDDRMIGLIVIDRADD